MDHAIARRGFLGGAAGALALRGPARAQEAGAAQTGGGPAPSPYLPEQAPDTPVTVFELTCDGPAFVDHHLIRPEWPRYGVGVPA